MKRRKKPDALGVAISDVHARMRVVGTDDEEYKRLIVYLDRLMDMKAKQRPKFPVSPDTLAIVLGNLAIAIFVTQHERAHVITTKALNFMSKPK